MADEKDKEPVFEHPLEKMFAAEEAEIQKLVEGQGEETETAAGETEPEGVSSEEPEKEAPAKEEPVKEEPVKEAAAAPGAAAEETGEQKNATWKMIRELQKEKRDAEKKLAELEAVQKQQQQEQPPEDTDFEDPIAKIQAEQETLRQQMLWRDQRDQQRAVFEAVDKEEIVFEKDHPDYRDAMRHLVQTRRDEYEALGLLDNAAVAVLQNAPDQVEAYMRQNNKSINDSARDVAFAHLINQERVQFISAARAAGRSVAEAVYSIAQKRGWKNGQIENGELKIGNEGSAAQERVRQVKATDAATTSLSAMQNTGAPKDRKITKRSQLLQLDRADPNEAAKYIDEMDRKFGPGWVSDLE